MSTNVSSIEQDKVFVSEFKNGKKQSAFSKIYEKYYEKIRFKILIACRNDDLSDDLTSEVFIKVFEKLSDHYNDEKGCLHTWISTVANNHYRDYLRKKFVKKETSLDSITLSTNKDSDDNEQTVQFPSDCLNPLEIMGQVDLKRIMDNVINQALKKEIMKQVITLRYFKEFSMEEIAAELNVPVNTVKSQLFRAKSIMNDYMVDKVNPGILIYG